MLKSTAILTNYLAGSNYLHHSSTLFVLIFLTPWNFRRTIHNGVSSPVFCSFTNCILSHTPTVCGNLQLIELVACTIIKPARVRRHLIGFNSSHIFFFGCTIRGVGNRFTGAYSQGSVSDINFRPFEITIMFLADCPTVWQPCCQ